MSNKSMMRSTGIIALATALSRVLGFVRDIIFANFFGTSAIAQAFVVAFRIPNALRDLVGEGAMNSAVVPVLSEYKTLNDEKEFARAVSILFNISLAFLSISTLLGVIFSPEIVRIMAPGFTDDPEKLGMTIMLNRAIFPYLVLIGLTAYSMGVLNSINHFAAPAFGPAIMNLILIASTVWLYPAIGVLGLAIGVLAGGLAQLAINIQVMHSHGLRIDLKSGFKHVSVARIRRLLIPRAFGSAVYQVNIFVDTILASLSSVVGLGGVAALYYANRLIQFPLAIFALALAQVALPKMSRDFASDDISRMKETLSFSLRVVFVIMVPASFGLAVLGMPIVRILFQRGEFDAYSTWITQNALFYYSFGLMAYGGIKLMASAFYSMHDTRTPVKTALAAVILNIILSLILMWPMKLGGLALAASISATFNFILLYMSLRKKLGDFGTRVIVDSFLRVVAASLVMAIALKVFLSMHRAGLGFAGLCGAILSAVCLFVLVSHVVGVREVRGFFAWILEKR